MISEENRVFLKEKFNLDINSYTEEELNKLLDKINLILDDKIKEKENDILKLNQEIFIKEND